MEKQYTENYLESMLRDKVKALGGKAYKFISPGNAGVPDRLVILPNGRFGFAEMKKTGGGTLSKLQKAQIAFLRSLNCRAEVLSSPEHIDAFIKKLQEGG